MTRSQSNAIQSRFINHESSLFDGPYIPWAGIRMKTLTFDDSTSKRALLSLATASLPPPLAPLPLLTLALQSFGALVAVPSDRVTVVTRNLLLNLCDWNSLATIIWILHTKNISKNGSKKQMMEKMIKFFFATCSPKIRFCTDTLSVCSNKRRWRKEMKQTCTKIF